MNIGIITLHRCVNYGTVLQAYATKKTLEDLGHTADIINYKCDYEENLFQIKVYKDRRGLISFIGVLAHRISQLPRKRKFLKIRNQLTGKKVLHKNDLLKLNDKYDVFLSGSDQIWNYYITDMDGAYFQDFVKENHKKRSFASSFGVKEIPEKYKKLYSKYLSEYEKICVREESGAEIVKELTGKDAIVSWDPTFLISREDWNKLANKGEKKRSNKYIVVYQMLPSHELYEFAKELRIKTGYKVLWCSVPMGRICKSTLVLNKGVEEWLALIRNAEYIVTNSFHGTVFSIMFNKEFFCISSEQTKKTGSRIGSLLTRLELEKREVTNFSEISDEKIDYEYVNKKLDRALADNIDILKDMIG